MAWRKKYRQKRRNRWSHKKRAMLYPLVLRIWHAIHALAFCLLMLTGIQLRFPDWVGWFGTFRTVVWVHNICGFVAVFDYLLWLGFYVLKGEIVKQYVPVLADFTTGMLTQSAYYFGRIFLGCPPPFSSTPEAKFNSLQKIIYFGIMFILMPLQIVTGILLWDFERFHSIIGIFGGVRVVDAFHIMAAYLVTTFVIVHVYLSTLGPTFFFQLKAITVGYEVRGGKRRQVSP